VADGLVFLKEQQNSHATGKELRQLESVGIRVRWNHTTSNVNFQKSIVVTKSPPVMLLLSHMHLRVWVGDCPIFHQYEDPFHAAVFLVLGSMFFRSRYEGRQITVEVWKM
jgi:hypothetical protein